MGSVAVSASWQEVYVDHKECLISGMICLTSGHWHCLLIASVLQINPTSMFGTFLSSFCLHKVTPDIFTDLIHQGFQVQSHFVGVKINMHPLQSCELK